MGEKSIKTFKININPPLEEGEINILAGLTYDDLSEDMVTELIRDDIKNNMKRWLTIKLQKRRNKGWSRWEEVVVDLGSEV